MHRPVERTRGHRADLWCCCLRPLVNFANGFALGDYRLFVANAAVPEPSAVVGALAFAGVLGGLAVQKRIVR